MFLTDRLTIRRFRSEDADDLYAYLADPQTYRFEPGEPIDREQAGRMATDMGASPDFWAIELRSASRVIGQVFLKQIEPLEHLTCELGYILNPAYQREGFGSEAAATLVRHALTSGGMHRVIAHCNPENPASWKLLEKIGFRREGLLKQNIFFRRNAAAEPLWIDTYLYAMLATECQHGADYGALRTSPANDGPPSPHESSIPRRIISLDSANPAAIQQAASLLVSAFSEHWPNAWPDLDAALEEVHECMQADNICRAAVDEEGRVLGWIGAQPAYGAPGWELHPLVVDPAHQGRGIGRALVLDLQEQVRQRGGVTIFLGTDDEDGMTSLAGIDLYPDVAEHMRAIRNFKRHPYEFYQKLGYAIVGVIPDANGLGKPDILMAKRLSHARE
jgi:aminoglycoside 6'-N-acetyltransferase I